MGNISSTKYDSQPHLAAKLAGRQHCLLAFLSPACGLCNSLQPALSKVEAEAGSWLAVARLDSTQDKAWAPEMLRYDVETVPCLVLLGPDGRAICKTGQPTTARQMASDLEEMLRAARR